MALECHGVNEAESQAENVTLYNYSTVTKRQKSTEINTILYIKYPTTKPCLDPWNSEFAVNVKMAATTQTSSRHGARYRG